MIERPQEPEEERIEADALKPRKEKVAVSGEQYRMAGMVEFDGELKVEFLEFLGKAGLGGKDREAWERVFTHVVGEALRKSEGREVRVEWSHSWELMWVVVEGDCVGGVPDIGGIGEGFEVRESTSKGWYEIILERRHDQLEGQISESELLNSTLEELSLSYESLTAFYKLGDALIHTEHVHGFIENALQDLRGVVPSDAVFISFSEHLEKKLGEDLRKIGNYRRIEAKGESRQREVMEGLEEYLWDSKAEVEGDTVLEKYGSGLCVPIKAENRVLGVIALARKKEGVFFNSGELNTVRTFADLFGIAIAQANNMILREQSQRAVNELEIAEELQHKLLPLPKVDERDQWSLYTQRKSAREVGGDYVDAVFGRQGDFYMVMVDVMGKGISAAFLAAMLRTAFHITIGFQYTLSGLIHALNRILCEQVGELTMFATCSIIRISRDCSVMEVANAGHCAPLLLRGEGIEMEFEPSGPPLGLFSETDYSIQEYKLEKGDRMIMLSDGLYEWEDQNAIWGWENFRAYLIDKRHEEPAKIWEGLQQKIRVASAKGDSHEDDETFLCWTLNR